MKVAVPEALLDTRLPEGGDAPGNPEAAQEALDELVGYSLAARDAGTFRVHRLVMETTRRGLAGEAARARLIQALGWMDAAFVGNPQDVRSWPRLVPLAEHAEAVADRAAEAGIDDPTARVMNDLGVLFDTQAR